MMGLRHAILFLSLCLKLYAGLALDQISWSNGSESSLSTDSAAIILPTKQSLPPQPKSKHEPLNIVLGKPPEVSQVLKGSDALATNASHLFDVYINQSGNEIKQIVAINHAKNNGLLIVLEGLEQKSSLLELVVDIEITNIGKYQIKTKLRPSNRSDESRKNLATPFASAPSHLKVIKVIVDPEALASAQFFNDQEKEAEDSSSFSQDFAKAKKAWQPGNNPNIELERTKVMTVYLNSTDLPIATTNPTELAALASQKLKIRRKEEAKDKEANVDSEFGLYVRQATNLDDFNARFIGSLFEGSEGQEATLQFLGYPMEAQRSICLTAKHVLVNAGETPEELTQLFESACHRWLFAVNQHKNAEDYFQQMLNGLLEAQPSRRSMRSFSQYIADTSTSASVKGHLGDFKSRHAAWSLSPPSISRLLSRMARIDIPEQNEVCRQVWNFFTFENPVPPPARFAQQFQYACGGWFIVVKDTTQAAQYFQMLISILTKLKGRRENEYKSRYFLRGFD